MVRRRSRLHLGGGCATTEERHGGTALSKDWAAPWEGKPLEGEVERRMQVEIDLQGRRRSKPEQGCDSLNPELNPTGGTFGGT